ncbi:hypothetical protein ACLOJK_028460 [Asimina triloba]
MKGIASGRDGAMVGSDGGRRLREWVVRRCEGRKMVRRKGSGLYGWRLEGGDSLRCATDIGNVIENVKGVTTWGCERIGVGLGAAMGRGSAGRPETAEATCREKNSGRDYQISTPGKLGDERLRRHRSSAMSGDERRCG